jgi:hypothetical protein
LCLIYGLYQVDSAGSVQLASWVRKLQNLEREKLQLTVILHVERRRLSQIDDSCETSESACTHKCHVSASEDSEDAFAAHVQVCVQAISKSLLIKKVVLEVFYY